MIFFLKCLDNQLMFVFWFGVCTGVGYVHTSLSHSSSQWSPSILYCILAQAFGTISVAATLSWL